jgi:hypothetical protein
MIRRRLTKGDAGFALPELVIAAAIAFGAFAMIGTFLMNAFTGTVFTQGQAATLDDVRIVMQQIEKEVRGADSLEFCSPSGSCLKVDAQSVSGGFHSVRYTHTGTELRRELFDPDTSTWGVPLVVIERVANAATQKVFSCDTQSSLLKVTVDLYVHPTPQSDPSLNVQTSVRPRNFPSASVCP